MLYTAAFPRVWASKVQRQSHAHSRSIVHYFPEQMLPPMLCKLSKLKTLRAGENKIRFIPDDIQKLAELEVCSTRIVALGPLAGCRSCFYSHRVGPRRIH